MMCEPKKAKERNWLLHATYDEVNEELSPEWPFEVPLVAGKLCGNVQVNRSRICLLMAIVDAKYHSGS